jgi:PIN domain nuclease of toxin-antitoxin system
MIVLDTHIWVWWVDGSTQLNLQYQNWIEEHKTHGLGVSVISCWEVAKLVENGRLKLQCSVEEWIEQALVYPGVQLLQLTPRIAIESTQLPGSFHRDPADQIIVATARVCDCPLLTADERILRYPHVKLPR